MNENKELPGYADYSVLLRRLLKVKLEMAKTNNHSVYETQEQESISYTK